jgi:hypothetical protein
MTSKHRIALLVALLAIPILIAAALIAAARDGEEPTLAAPVFGVTLPDGYRDWPLIAPAQEAAPFNELRVVVGNEVAMQAFRDNQRPFPDGTVLVKRAWKRVSSADFASASVPGSATTVQIMVKDSKRYAATGGWLWALHRRQTRGRSTASHLPCLPRRTREGSRLRFYPPGAVSTRLSTPQQTPRKLS